MVGKLNAVKNNNILKGKTALVTAASRGIGFACALSLARAGAELVICSSNLSSIKRAARKIKLKTNEPVEAYQCDLANIESVNHFISSIKEKELSFDIIVVNHGNPQPGNYDIVSSENWQHSFNQCFFSTINILKNFIPDMKHRKWGRIFFINSIYSKEPDQNFIISSSIRAGLLAFAKCLSKDLAIYGIGVNSILPGFTNTSLLSKAAEKIASVKKSSAQEILKEWTLLIPTNKLTEPSDIGSIINKMSSNAFDNFTGNSIQIDGGYLNGS